jgi:hypothetical protein
MSQIIHYSINLISNYGKRLIYNHEAHNKSTNILIEEWTWNIDIKIKCDIQITK